MLLVKTELHPYGDSSKKSTICVVAIANIGQVGNGDYNYLIVAKEKDMYGGRTYAVKVVTHNRSLPLFYLLNTVFSELLDEWGNYGYNTDKLTERQLEVFNILKSDIESEVL